MCLHSEKAHDVGITHYDVSSQPVPGGEQGLQFFWLASGDQDFQIKIWVISFTHILGFELKYKRTLTEHRTPIVGGGFFSWLADASLRDCLLMI